MDYVPEHAEAEERLNLLDKSISRFRKVLDMQTNNADAMFNLAQGLTVRADLVEDVDGITDAHGEAAQALQEAVSLYESAYELQEKLHQQQTHGGGSSSSSNTPIAISKAPVTAFTLIETLTSLVDATRSLGEMLDDFEDVQLLYKAALSKISLAYGILAESTESEEDTSAIVQLYQSHASLLAALADRTFTDTGALDEKSYKTAIETLAKVVILDQDNVEAHCDLGDLFGGYAQAKMRTCTDQDISSQEEKSLWELYTEATRCFQTALDYQPDNLNTLFKLGDIHFTRAQLPFAIAQKQKTQLLKSAEYWYKHAVDLETSDLEGGWLPWAMSAWAIAKWTHHMEKLTEAENILKLWIEQGGSLDLLKEVGRDNIVMPDAFITWASGILLQ
jgi:tetratricopeptide (TPR) repeat protein